MRRPFTGLFITACVAGLLLIVLSWLIQRDSASPLVDGSIAPPNSTNQNASAPTQPGLPDESRFELAGESNRYKLWADLTTGHFKVESKASGVIWRSYPDPETWEEETASGIWHSNMLSPLMLEYIDASNSKSQTKLTNWMEERGTLELTERTSNGFRITYHLPSSGFHIPIEVALIDDYVEVKVHDSGIKEGTLSLLNMKVFPLFGAQPSKNNAGYLLLPDGSGALISFDENRSNDKSIYRETVYGKDIAFYNETTNRTDVTMPIFGLKWSKAALLGVMTEGEEYSKLFAAPSGSLGMSNWVTPEWQYRIKFFQNTDRRGVEGFYTYSKERFEASARTVRYYLLEEEQANYAGMASRYRQYLIEEQGAERITPDHADIPFFADLIGADLKQGLLWDDYIVGTTTDSAEVMLQELNASGIANVTAIYHGWQRWGYSSYGGLFPVDKRLGGNKGMKQLAQRAERLGGKLLLAANYSLNNSGRGGFWNLKDGLRNLAGTLQEASLSAKDEKIPIVSPLYSFREALADLESYQELGVDGILFTGGIGSMLYSDFNSSNRADRTAVQDGQRSVLKNASSKLGFAAVESANLYSLPDVNHIHRLADDYSYDIFVDEAVPFAQIALHGLVTYTSEWGNLRDEYVDEFLRSVEFGAYPAYVFTDAPTERFKQAYSIRYYSMNYRDWLESASEQYSRLNEALRDVQDQFIIGHRKLADGVKETLYENGQRIIVNYNDEPYTDSEIIVPAKDFIVVKGGNGS